MGLIVAYTGQNIDISPHFSHIIQLNSSYLLHYFACKTTYIFLNSVDKTAVL